VWNTMILQMKELLGWTPYYLFIIKELTPGWVLLLSLRKFIQDEMKIDVQLKNVFILSVLWIGVTEVIFKMSGKTLSHKNGVMNLWWQNNNQKTMI